LLGRQHLKSHFEESALFMEEVMTETLKTSDENAKQESSQLREGPLFVVGMFRSGTSLLYALLNQHPQIALTYEDDLAYLPSLFWFPTNTSRWFAKWDSWNGGPSRHKVPVTDLSPDISDLQTAAREVYIKFAEKKGAAVWGCKSPTFFDSLARLGRTFPNARFVIIWRDLYDVCNSILKAKVEASYFKRPGMILRAILGYLDMRVQSDWLVKHGLPVHEIWYEDMVTDSEAVMRGICEFVQLPFNPKMSSLKGADRSVIENGSHHSLVKSEKIFKPRQSRDALPMALKTKIDRYLHRWRKQYNGAWPRYPQSLEGKSSGPSLLERCRDRVAYNALWVGYHSIPVVFCLVPSRVWNVYRRLRGRAFEWQEAQYEVVKGRDDRAPR
jgi:Sulfotransferase family